jgi:hypothetical protein
LFLTDSLHRDVIRPARDEAVEGRLGGSGGFTLLDHIGLTQLGILGVDGHLVVRVDPGRVWRLPQYQQGGLISKPNNKPTRRVRLGGEVGADRVCKTNVV